MSGCQRARPDRRRYVRERPVPVQVNGIGAQHVSGIAEGIDFSLVLGTDGSVWTGVSTSSGQLGDGGTANAIVPVEAQGPGSGITQLAAGDFHVSRCARRHCGGLGDNNNGHSATGPMNPPSPTRRGSGRGLGSVTAVSAGFLFSLAIIRSHSSSCRVSRRVQRDEDLARSATFSGEQPP